MIRFFTIGFTRKSAQYFFDLLEANHVSQIIDVRIHDNSQLAGFSKSENLKFFCRRILDISYRKIIDFAPPEDLMVRWRARLMSYEDYKSEYIAVLEKRCILDYYEAKEFDNACFLCSEDEPDYCHRKILAEYFRDHSVEFIDIKHLQ